MLGLDSLDLAESKLSFERDLESNISFALSPVFEGANLCAHMVSTVFFNIKMYVLEVKNLLRHSSVECTATSLCRRRTPQPNTGGVILGKWL